MSVEEGYFQILHLTCAMTRTSGLGNGQGISNLNILRLAISPRIPVSNGREMPVSILWRCREDGMIIGEEGIVLGC